MPECSHFCTPARETCRGIVNKASASPAVHQRMTGQYMLDVFGGPGFLAKASNHLGLRGYVLNTKFGPRKRTLFLVGIVDKKD